MLLMLWVTLILLMLKYIAVYTALLLKYIYNYLLFSLEFPVALCSTEQQPEREARCPVPHPEV